MSRIADNDRVKYVFYLKTEGGDEYPIPDPKSKDGSGYWVEYPESLPEFLPQLWQEMDNDKQSDLVRESYKAERASQKGTFKGPLETLTAKRQQRMAEIEGSLKQYEKVQDKLLKKPKHNIVEKLLGE